MSKSSQGVYVPLPQSISDSDSEKEEKTHYVSNGVISSKIKFSEPKNGYIYTDDVNTNRKLSNKRRFALMLSIFLCFLPIIIFLWVLPCQDTNTCSLKISNWESSYDNIELMGPINLVRGIFHKNWNLAFIYKGIFTNLRPFKNGVISLLGNGGAIAWDFQQESSPYEINCTTIDVDTNGLYDCLLVHSSGLEVIETISGAALWHAHSSEEKSIPELEMPVRIDDLDKDNTDELLTIYKDNLLIISGRTGKALSIIKPPSNCPLVSIKSTTKNYIRYICSNNIYEISLNDIKSKYFNSSAEIKLNLIQNDDNTTFYHAGDKKLVIENSNTCPRCQSILTLYSSNNTQLNSWVYDNAVAMTPITFRFPSSRPLFSFESYIRGFIIKMWQWQDTSLKLSPTSRIYNKNGPVHNETFHINVVSESIVLILLKGNQVQIENVSLTDIYLICSGPQHNDCQPDYKNQKESLLMVDLDFDNSVELVSFSSSYKRIEVDGYETWQLASKVNVFRLESEFPKLLDSK